jgi:hypothetical protein
LGRFFPNNRFFWLSYFGKCAQLDARYQNVAGQMDDIVGEKRIGSVVNSGKTR